VGSETAWIKKGGEPPLSVPPAPALKEVAVVNPTPTPLSHDELNDLLDYGTWRMNNSQCSLDPNRREVRVTALTDDKALLMVSCEAGATTPSTSPGWCHVKSPLPPEASGYDCRLRHRATAVKWS
jgi:hypothetical protein